MNVVLPDYRDFWHGMVSVCIMTAGTIFLMWVGEQIDEYGIGNGISLLIMAGILARVPVAMKGLWENSTSKLSPEPGKYGIITILLLLGLFIAVVVGVIAITESQRRIPTQSAKHVRGRRVFGGTKQFLPLKVNQAGVMPIIFASSLLIFPSFVFSSLARATSSLRTDQWTFASFFAGMFQEIADAFQRQSYIYTVCYIILIYFFCYFWTAITFNPKDMAENLKDYGSFIPGYRPGRRTADYLEKGDAADHLRRRGVPGAGGGHSVAGPGVAGRRLDRGVVPGWNGTLDRHQRLPRSGAEDRQPPGDEKLHGTGQRR